VFYDLTHPRVAPVGCWWVRGAPVVAMGYYGRYAPPFSRCYFAACARTRHMHIWGWLPLLTLSHCPPNMAPWYHGSYPGAAKELLMMADSAGTITCFTFKPPWHMCDGRMACHGV
jgi:hypothetical protein